MPAYLTVFESDEEDKGQKMGLFSRLFGKKDGKNENKSGTNTGNKNGNKTEPIVYVDQNGVEVQRAPLGVYPFTGTINGERIPYEADLDTLRALLKSEMKTYVCALRALAWQNTQESFDLLRGELDNRDGYKRRAVLENIRLHSAWQEKRFLTKSMLLDDNPYVVKIALGGIDQFDPGEATGELLYIMEQYQSQEEIRSACIRFFEKHQIPYQELLEKRRREREENSVLSVLEGASQRSPEGRLYLQEDANRYFEIIRTYSPYATDDDCEKLLKEISVQGCGYASLIAALMQYGQCREPVWEREFGKVDFEQLLLHFYCMTKGPEYGMLLSRMEEHFCRFCSHFGLEADLSIRHGVSGREVRDQDDTTYYLMIAEDFVLRDEKHERIHVREGHCMNLTDVREFDTYYVFSWGKAYTLRKQDIRKSYWFVRIKFR